MTTPDTSLLALRERVAKLSGPDRDVDAEVALAVGYTRIDTGIGTPAYPMWEWYDPKGVVLPIRGWLGLPHWTGSVEAALSLIEQQRPAPKWGWGVGCSTAAAGPFVAELRRTGIIEPTDEYHFGATPALALLIALLTSLTSGADHV